MLETKVIGHLGNDAEIKNISGKDYYSFSVAHSEKRGGIDKTVWIKCLKRVGESTRLGDFLKKGTLIYLSGTPYATGYHSTQANKIVADINLFINQLQLLGSNSNAQTQNGPAPQNTSSDDDDLPF